jgi:hypothetical protein
MVSAKKRTAKWSAQSGFQGVLAQLGILKTLGKGAKVIGGV